MKRTIHLVVRIEYDYNKEYPKVSEKYNDLTAMELALNPNFDTIEEDVSLEKVQANLIEPYMLIDFEKLEHYPDEEWQNNN